MRNGKDIIPGVIKSSPIGLSATYLCYFMVKYCDFNNNSRVDIGDASKFAYFLVGKVDEL